MMESEFGRFRRRRPRGWNGFLPTTTVLQSEPLNNDNEDLLADPEADILNQEEEEEDEEAFLKQELARIESLDRFIDDDDDEEEEADDGYFEDDEEALLEEAFMDFEEGDEMSASSKSSSDKNKKKMILEKENGEFLSDLLLLGDDDDIDAAAAKAALETPFVVPSFEESVDSLERALIQDVVPAQAGVGDYSLVGDIGWDPLELSKVDYIGQAQRAILSLLPFSVTFFQDDEPVEIYQNNTFAATTTSDNNQEIRHPALILRDYREAEIRHGRLAMLAAIVWPLQEMLDRFILGPSSMNPLLYQVFVSHGTLPYFPLFMTSIMVYLGFLDVRSIHLRLYQQLGEAYLPGDLFWDPLKILNRSAPTSMKRNMQGREIANGRTAMLAVIVYMWEEAYTEQPLVQLHINDFIFEPAYQIPIIHQWLDSIFASSGGIGGGPII